jgi:hypothetical protein
MADEARVRSQELADELNRLGTIVCGNSSLSEIKAALEEMERVFRTNAGFIIAQLRAIAALPAGAGMTPKECSAHVREHANSFPEMSRARACLHQAAEYIDRVATEVTPEMRRLIIAARIVAFEDQGPASIKELDEASEAFAELVPWDDEPAPPPSPPTPGGET